MRFSLFNFSTEKRSASANQTGGTLTNPAKWLLDALGGNFSTTVTPANALKLGSVYSCIRNISEDLGTMPVYLYQKGEDGSRQKIRDPRAELLNLRASELQTGPEFRQNTTGQALGNGNGIARIERGANNKPLRLHYYPFHEVTVTCVNRKLYYKFLDHPETLPFTEVIHLRAYSTDGELGISPIMNHAITIGGGLGAKNLNRKFYENGGWLKGFLKLSGSLKEGRGQELGKEWDDNYGGPDNAYRTPVLHSGTEFVPVTLPQKDAQYIENSKFTREEIAGIFRIPPALIGDTEKMNFNVMEQVKIQYVVFTLMPWVKRWEKELSYKLLTAQERNQGLQFKFDVNSLLRGDTAARGNFYTQLLDRGVLSPNEVRGMENLNPRPGGDEYYTQVNMQISEQVEAQVNKTLAEIQKLKEDGNA